MFLGCGIYWNKCYSYELFKLDIQKGIILLKLLNQNKSQIRGICKKNVFTNCRQICFCFSKHSAPRVFIIGVSKYCVSAVENVFSILNLSYKFVRATWRITRTWADQRKTSLSSRISEDLFFPCHNALDLRQARIYGFLEYFSMLLRKTLATLVKYFQSICKLSIF